VVDLDADGSVISKGTHKGAGTESSWARGQAWGLYGFTMAYRETGIVAYKEMALTIADYILSVTFPENVIPYWDYSVSGNEPRDASAAAITASSLLELMHYDTEKRNTYFESARAILDVLGTAEYTAEPGTNNNFLLRYSVGNKPANSEVDVPIIYADYYYVEALLRLRALQPDGAVSFQVNDPANGSLSGNAPELIYTPNQAFAGADQFTFTASAGGLQSKEATVQIDVLPVVETLPIWYRNVFSNGTQANQPASSADWELYSGSSGTAISAFDGSITPRGGVGFGVGKPVDQHNALEGQQVLVSEQELGYVYIFNDAPIDYFAYTESTLDRSQLEPTQISWYQGHNRSDMESRVALRIEGQWYVSTEGFTNPAVSSGSDFNAQAEQQVFTFTTMASAWQALDFVPGSTLALGANLTQQLPGGNVEAFGLLVLNSSTNESKTLRFDTYQVEVEEASANVAVLQGQLSLQNRSDNSSTIKVEIYEPGTANLVQSFATVEVDPGGNFTLSDLPDGNYDVYVKSAIHLASMQTVSLSAGANAADFGLQLAGDIDGNNVINLQDFSALSSTFNLQEGDAGYDARADLDGNGAINLQDFSVLSGNFNEIGAEVPQS